MIADIYGKISRSGSNLSEKLEDKLTGDIFGTMRYLPSEKLLLPFLNKAYCLNPRTHERQSPVLNFSFEPEIVFWPRHYPNIEPDVEIKGEDHGDRIKILIEVKYKSGLSSDDSSSEDVTASESNNQLIKQAQALADDIENSNKLVIFLTEDGSYPQEILNRVANLMKSDTKLSKIHLYWLSWHDLTSVVTSLSHDHLSVYENRIANDLIQYCNRKGFRRYEYRPPKQVPRWSFTNQIYHHNSATPLSFTTKVFQHANIIGKKWCFSHE